MHLKDRFISFISQENLFSPKDKLLLAVSGGLDSVVLCELCQQAGYDFVIAHCNFQLRAEESERDEQFVRELGEKYGKQVLVKKFDTAQYAASKKISIQVAARELRYEWFDRLVDSEWSIANGQLSIVNVEQLKDNENAPVRIHYSPLTAHLLTAHQLDDNIETILMNFFKGTGIAGLRGMLPKQGKIVRPLLFAKKEALKQFAVENGLEWVEDSSNQSDKYSRNYLRHQLIPLVTQIYPETGNNLAANLQRFRDIEVLYHQSIDIHKKKLLEYKGNEIHIPVLKLKKTTPLVSVVYEIIKDYHFSAAQADEVIALLDAETGKYVQSATHRVIKNRHWLIISPNQTEEARHILIEENDSEIFFSGGLLVLTTNSQFPIPNSNDTALLDAKEILFPLLLRKWKAGDYFYPLGMQKKKKLARFFIDQKLSKTEKEKIWVLEMNKKIIWVVGYRIDDRFKISPQTKKMLQLTLQDLKK